MRIMALDFGTKRIGIAVSDELFITAQGLPSLYRKDLKSDLDEIGRIAKSNDVREIIVGLPLSMNGSYSAKTKEVVAFVDDLLKTVDIAVKTWDERLTSMQAEGSFWRPMSAVQKGKK